MPPPALAAWAGRWPGPPGSAHRLPPTQVFFRQDSFAERLHEGGGAILNLQLAERAAQVGLHRRQGASTGALKAEAIGEGLPGGCRGRRASGAADAPPNSRARLNAKLDLVQKLYPQGFTVDQFKTIYDLIEMVLVLPASLEYNFRESMKRFEEESQMPRLNSWEKMGLEQGLEQGLKQGRDEGRLELQAARLEILQAARLEIARKMLDKGRPADEILELTGLRLDEIEPRNGRAAGTGQPGA